MANDITQFVAETIRLLNDYVQNRLATLPSELSVGLDDSVDLADIDTGGTPADIVNQVADAYDRGGKGTGQGTAELVRRLAEAEKKINELISHDQNSSLRTLEQMPAELPSDVSSQDEEVVTGLTEIERRKPILLPDDVVLFGKPTAAFSSGTTITLDPCDVSGTDTGEDNVTVYTQADQSSYSMTNSTTIPTTQIVPYILGDDDAYYMLGTPVEIITDRSTSFQKKTRNVWMLTPGTESEWVEGIDGPDEDFKVFQRLEDDSIGWDWVRAH